MSLRTDSLAGIELTIGPILTKKPRSPWSTEITCFRMADTAATSMTKANVTELAANVVKARGKRIGDDLVAILILCCSTGLKAIVDTTENANTVRTKATMCQMGHKYA